MTSHSSDGDMTFCDAVAVLAGELFPRDDDPHSQSFSDIVMGGDLEDYVDDFLIDVSVDARDRERVRLLWLAVTVLVREVDRIIPDDYQN